MTGEHIHFVTGRLAESSLRSVVGSLASALGFDYSIDVLPITVAALMTPKWIGRHIRVPTAATRVLIPGYCQGDLSPLQDLVRPTIERGPKDLRQLPEYFGQHDSSLDDYGSYDIEIVAEINHAPQLSLQAILDLAAHYQRQGADIIDVGCEPGDPWDGVADCVRALRDSGHRVSIDSLQPAEIATAIRAGAELVLSVNSSNRSAACDWGCEVVVIPDDSASLTGFDETIEFLTTRGVPVRLDPVLEPIGCGFAASLERYLAVRRRYPQAEMLMGIANLTELTDADSAGINVLLLGLCQELGIRSVLTTEVINWARTSVRECDLARRLVHFAVQQRRPPKHIEPRLVSLRDPRLYPLAPQELADLAARIRDHNYRIFAADDGVHLISAGLHLKGHDPFRMWEQLLDTQPQNVNASHAFYLGYELAKAATARALGKQYEQDQPLQWGHLTPEPSAHGPDDWPLKHRG
jgi:dihydropteroate synthase-like protein